MRKIKKKALGESWLDELVIWIEKESKTISRFLELEQIEQNQI
jgi:hypothetical protein